MSHVEAPPHPAVNGFINAVFRLIVSEHSEIVLTTYHRGGACLFNNHEFGDTTMFLTFALETFFIDGLQMQERISATLCDSNYLKIDTSLGAFQEWD